MRMILAALILSASPVLAQEIVSPDEFRDWAEGYTLHFERDGAPFGSEAFQPDGRVKWRFSDGSCLRGVWRAYGAQLCFLYEGDTAAPQCWRMLRDRDGLLARLLDGPDKGLELRITRRDRANLLCGEPGRST